MNRSGLLVRCGALALATLGVGCTGPEDPSVASVAGQYVAGRVSDSQMFGVLEITTISNGEVINWLDRDASFNITLDPGGTSGGRLFIPGANEDGGDLDLGMEGTWTLQGTVVRFTQTADTFVRDMDWLWEENQLVGEETFGDTFIRVVLHRSN